MTASTDDEALIQQRHRRKGLLFVAAALSILLLAHSTDTADARVAEGIEPAAETCDAECEQQRTDFAAWLESLPLGEKAFALHYVAPDYLAHLDATRPLDAFLDFLVVCEQSGNWQATSRSYAGGFGFLYTTWRMMAQPEYGLAAFVDAWPTMNLAPPWAQRIAAAQLYYVGGSPGSSWPACWQRWTS